MEYSEFLQSKIKIHKQTGFDIDECDIPAIAYPFQRFIIRKALKAGRFAVFADCGLGKTIMQLVWGNAVCVYTDNPVIILAPLAIIKQTLLEAEKFGLQCDRLHEGLLENKVYITNYEQIDNIDCSLFSGVVLDESSILKNFTGATKEKIIESFANTEYKLACTATPSPNDELELGNHAEFLNVCSSRDMRSEYFTTDKELIKSSNKYRLKKHSEKEFYKWVSSWAIMISKPSDIGFDDSGYILPSLNYIETVITTENRNNGTLFNSVSVSATDFNRELKNTMGARLAMAAEIANSTKEQYIIWVCHDAEEAILKELIPDAVVVTGKDKNEVKEKNLIGFARNEFRVLITKAKIAQFGLNYQNCFNQIHPSVDFSFEKLYQQIRRSYRYGQKKDVNIYLITTDTMSNVRASIMEKEEKFIKMQDEMRNAIISATKSAEIAENKVRIEETPDYRLILGDCVSEVRKLADCSIDYSFFSPPFGALYVFSDSPNDMSNVRDNAEFLNHFRFLVVELNRVIKEGRLVSVHMMQSTTLLGRDGFYSICDFRGDIIRLFQECGFLFHAENMIRKDPKTAAIRTKNRQLMHGTTKTDSSIVRPGLADYILTFRKRGENAVPIQNNIPFDLWCKIAEPVWIDIEEGDTLDYRAARSSDDERHITPTQLKPIEWCYNMWVNKGETVLSPFSGVASEGSVAIKTGRKYIGIELKESYFNLSIKNLNAEIEAKKQLTLF